MTILSTADKDKIINQLIGIIDIKDPKGYWCQGWLRDSLIDNNFWIPNPYVLPKPHPIFSGSVCKGAKELNSHCGKCEKCRYYGWCVSDGFAQCGV